MTGAPLDPRLVVWTGALLAARLQQRTARDGEPDPVIDNFAARVRGGWIMAALVGPIHLGGPGGVVLLFAVCSMGRCASS